jgi:PAS domain-containing protein
VKSQPDKRKSSLFTMIFSMASLFASFIALCGLSHALDLLLEFFPDSRDVQIAMGTVMVVSALVSLATAVAGSQLFGPILMVMSKYELNSEGNLQHVENYLVEVVELVKESVIVLSEDLRVQRCNEASMALFHCKTLLHEAVIKFIHPEDFLAFKEAVRETLRADVLTPVTVEYRVYVPKTSRVELVETPSPVQSRRKRASSLRRQRSVSWGSSADGTAGKVFPIADDVDDAVDDSTPVVTRLPSVSADFSATSAPEPGSADQQAGDAAQYTWVESTICRGMRLDGDEGHAYDLKMVSRNIDGRKKEAEVQYQNILRASEEQARINAAKLRYISCIAHDLKTPLQSFCFSLDLLQQTPMHAEQRECVAQANVAVDLMKLTISQTMDISKALTGAKLQPRRATVFLSTVIERVQIIM